MTNKHESFQQLYLIIKSMLEIKELLKIPIYPKMPQTKDLIALVDIL